MPPTLDTDGAVFERMRPRLKSISCRILGSEAEAEDVVQDCFLKWRDADQASLATPAAWLTTVVQRQSIDRLRQRSREAFAARTAAELVPETPQPTPEELLLRGADMAAALARLQGRLSASERLALVLHEVFECEHADIAKLLATSTDNSRQLLLRARRRLSAGTDEPPAAEKLCRELVRAFQAAINGRDQEAVLTLLGDPQPVAVKESASPRLGAAACANDAVYLLSAAA